MEIVIQRKNYLLQQTFHKKFYHFNRNSRLRSVKQKNDPVGLPESESDKKIRLPLHQKKNSDFSPTPHETEKKSDSDSTKKLPTPPKKLRLITTPTPQPCSLPW